jgi:crotonobetainyl-CoA:carnitine CoA-transferase CaiB-like acyl-CoA transferase
MTASTTVQPLSGIKVLDFSTLLPGPLATLFLAEAGAEVIKIERPGEGEEMRHYHPRWGRDPVNFAMLNRGKKSLALDLKSPRHLEFLIPLIEEADIIVEQFRPGVMERLGLHYEAVKLLNPRIVYCSITGYGQTGANALKAGHDLNYIGDAGLLALSMGPDEQPTVPPFLAADIAGGSYPAVVNILMALLQREKTGKGSHLDIAMTDNMFMLMWWAIGQGLATGNWPGNGASQLTGGSPRYKIYPAADGRHVAVAALEQKFWDRFCEVIGLAEPFRNDSADPVATTAAVAALISGQPSSHWEPLLAQADCCCTIVRTLREAMCDDSFHDRGVFDHTLVNEAWDTLPATPVAVAPQFRGDPSVEKSAPALGAHNDILLGGGK